jgi:hypothetical protein
MPNNVFKRSSNGIVVSNSGAIGATVAAAWRKKFLHSFAEKSATIRPTHDDALRRRARHARATLYNVLCIAYGADKQLFGDIVEKGYLPKEDCKDEYQQVAYAYEKLIGPHADRGRAKKYLTRVGCSRRDNNGAHIRISGGCKSEFFLLLRCDGVGPESHGSAQHFEKDSS